MYDELIKFNFYSNTYTLIIIILANLLHLLLSHIIYFLQMKQTVFFFFLFMNKTVYINKFLFRNMQ